MTTVWIVVVVDGDRGGFLVRECEGSANDDGTWTVNVRGKSGSSKLLEVLPAELVHITFDAAMSRKRAIEALLRR